MSEYTVTSQTAVTPAHDDVQQFSDTSTGGVGRAQLNEIVAFATVSLTATTTTLTAATYANRIMRIAVTPATVVLPAASGSGHTYTFYVTTAATATESTIKVANATDIMKGVVWAATTSSDNAEAFITTATSDSIEMNGTTKGGVAGDLYVLRDVATGVWSVQGFTSPTGTEVTPFDATVS